jgi:hypothetical protein
MPSVPTKGKEQLATQVSADVLEAFRAYVRERNETMSAALERAMRREMAYPPPPADVPPLGDSPAARKKPNPAAARKKRKPG